MHPYKVAKKYSLINVIDIETCEHLTLKTIYKNISSSGDDGELNNGEGANKNILENGNGRKNEKMDKQADANNLQNKNTAKALPLETKQSILSEIRNQKLFSNHPNFISIREVYED